MPLEDDFTAALQSERMWKVMEKLREETDDADSDDEDAHGYSEQDASTKESEELEESDGEKEEEWTARE